MFDWDNKNDQMIFNEVVNFFVMGDFVVVVFDFNGDGEIKFKFKFKFVKKVYSEVGFQWIQQVFYNYNEFGDEGYYDWEYNVVVYEFDGEIGDVGFEYFVFEIQFFGEFEICKKQGVDFFK